MIKRGQTNSSISIQIVIGQTHRYKDIAESVFNAINQWRDFQSSNFDEIHIDLLVTDDLELASQSWNGSRTIILLARDPADVKTGIIVTFGHDISEIIKRLLNAS